jgi:hypothetical protein
LKGLLEREEDAVRLIFLHGRKRGPRGPGISSAQKIRVGQAGRVTAAVSVPGTRSNFALFRSAEPEGWGGAISALGNSVAGRQFPRALTFGPIVPRPRRESRWEHGFDLPRRFSGMATTIDHLRVDHRLTVLREFTDANGVTLRAGEGGILRGQAFDQIRLEIQLEIEQPQGKITLRFPLKASAGPRVGHMREFFELGDVESVPGTPPARVDSAARRMIVPVASAGRDESEPPRHAARDDDPDRLEDLEKEIQRQYPHIGASASIAEMYAQRMRRFQRAGNEARAVAAFKLAVDWMRTYASHATSGGEGAALSLQCDEFHAGLVREFGYDPTTAARQPGPGLFHP